MLSLLLVIGACGDDADTSASSDSPSEATTEVGATGSASEGATATGGSTSTSDGIPTTGETTDGGSTTLDDGTTGGDATTTNGDTTGGVDPDIVTACEAYCGAWDECGLQPDMEACVAGCSDSLVGVTGACKAANQASLACMTALSCADLLASLDDQEGGPCGEEKASVAEACDAACNQSVSGGDDVCELTFECQSAPLQELKCDGRTCTCHEAGVQVGQCASEGVCMQGDAIFDKAASCCGFS